MRNHVRSTSTLSSGSALCAALLLTLAATGCHQDNNADVVASVNGHPIMRAEMDKAYKAQLEQAQQQQQQGAPSDDQADGLRLNVLNSLIIDEISAQRAAKMNLTATDAEVDAKLAEAKAPFSEEQFNAQLKARNLTLDEFKHDIRRSLTGGKLLNKEIESKITVTDADVASYFNAHMGEFNLRETQFHLAQIAVTSIPGDQAGNLENSKATSDVDAKKKIQALKNRLDSGEDFGAIAMHFSENPDTASNGGDMGFIAESQLHTHPDVYGAVLKLKPGQATEILPLVDGQTHKAVGYAIYKLISREPAGQRQISDPAVQQSIRQQLHDGRAQTLKAAYFEMLHDQAKIQNFFAEQVFKNAH